MSGNPNASVAAFAGAVTILVVWVVGTFGVDIPPEAASACTTILVTAILFLGRKTKPRPGAEH